MAGISPRQSHKLMIYSVTNRSWIRTRVLSLKHEHATTKKTTSIKRKENWKPVDYPLESSFVTASLFEWKNLSFDIILHFK